jgi:hypothetical protein
MGTKFVPPDNDGAGFFLTAEERAVLVENEVPLTVLAVKETIDTYNKKTRPIFKVTVDVEGEPRGISFGIGTQDGQETSRDRLFYTLREHLELEDGDPVEIVIEPKVGSFIPVRVVE